MVLYELPVPDRQLNLVDVLVTGGLQDERSAIVRRTDQTKTRRKVCGSRPERDSAAADDAVLHVDAAEPRFEKRELLHWIVGERCSVADVVGRAEQRVVQGFEH